MRELKSITMWLNFHILKSAGSLSFSLSFDLVPINVEPKRHSQQHNDYIARDHANILRLSLPIVRRHECVPGMNLSFENMFGLRSIDLKADWSVRTHTHILKLFWPHYYFAVELLLPHQHWFNADFISSFSAALNLLLFFSAALFCIQRRVIWELKLNSIQKITRATCSEHTECTESNHYAID